MAIPVRDINWADPLIDRAGIIPFVHSNGHDLIGIAVTANTAALSFLGGNFDATKDYDLLDTAVREYNEEVGTNCVHITVNDVLDLFAVRSSSTIQIFFPLKMRPSLKFVPTDEVELLLWVTPEQLHAMIDTQNAFIPGCGELRAFLSNKTVLDIAHILPDIHFDKLKHDGTDVLVQREQKIKVKHLPVTKVGVNELMVDAQIKKLFVGHVCLAVRMETLCVMRSDRTCYMMPSTELPNVVALLSPLNVTYYFTFDREATAFARRMNLQRRSVKCLETGARGFGDVEVNIIVQKYMLEINKLSTTYTQESIIRECNLVLDAECDLFKVIARKRLKFSRERASVYECIGLLNLLTEFIDIPKERMIGLIRLVQKYNHIDPSITVQLLEQHGVWSFPVPKPQ
jgi:8-oxo-dGTP pyrophosphatase MutT (NUDIX family)